MTFRSASSSTEELLCDARAPRPQKHIRPVREQDELESRRVWEKVTASLLAGQHSAASAAKNEVEEGQRALRRDRQRNGDVWVPALFEWIEDEEDKTASKESSQTSLSQRKKSLQSPSPFRGRWRFKGNGSLTSK